MRFYHGTRRGFTRGGWLTPRSFHRGAATTAPLKPGRSVPREAVEFIYVTADPKLAWAYAYAAAGRGAPKVLRVEPHGDLELDPEHSADMRAYRCAGWARVLEVLVVPPFTEAEALAGWVLEKDSRESSVKDWTAGAASCTVLDMETTTARFDTTEFRFSHGREPRGRGTWAFRPFRSDEEFVFSPFLTFGEAKRWVAETRPEVRFWAVGS